MPQATVRASAMIWNTITTAGENQSPGQQDHQQGVNHRERIVELPADHLPPLADRIGGHDGWEKGKQVDSPHGDHGQGIKQPETFLWLKYWSGFYLDTSEENGQHQEQETGGENNH